LLVKDPQILTIQLSLLRHSRFFS